MYSNFEPGEGIARQSLNLFFVIDNSGSMSGMRMGAVNNAIRDVISLMPEIQEDTADAEIKISALIFSDDAKWVYNDARSVEDFKWRDVDVEGGTNLTDAYYQLSKKLTKQSKGGMMPDIGGIAPIIILMTDGQPTSYDWEEELDKLKQKGWFKVALKYALAIEIDDDESMRVLTAFTGNSETVLKVYSAEALRKVIKTIAVTASKVKSKSSTAIATSQGANNVVAQQQIAQDLAEVDDVEW